MVTEVAPFPPIPVGLTFEKIPSLGCQGTIGEYPENILHFY